MKTCRIHITGASGTGATTLGRALAAHLALSHHDTDDFYWLPTSPPFREQRPIDERLRLMREMFLPAGGWVLSGSIVDWGAPLIPHFDLVVFLSASTEIRLARLRAREERHFGRAAVQEGGWRHQETEEFLEWASHYDDGSREGRSRARHEAWLAALSCPVMRLDGKRETDALVDVIDARLQAASSG